MNANTARERRSYGANPGIETLRPIILSAAILSLLWTQAIATESKTLPPRYRSTVAQECLRNLDRFDTTLHESGFGVLAPGSYKPTAPHSYFAPGKTPRQQIRTLRNAAYDLAMRGNETQCKKILDTMQDLYRRHQTSIEGDGKGQNPRTGWRRAHLAGAHRLSAMERPTHAAVLIGAELRNLEDQRLGEIVDVVFGAAKAKAVLVLVARGGFLGFGSDIVAIRWNDLLATEDHETFVLDVAMMHFEKAPIIDKRNFRQLTRGPWREKLDKFWNKALRDRRRN